MGKWLGLLSMCFWALSVGGHAMAEAPPKDAPLPTVEEILARIDQNMTFQTRESTIEMTVINPRRTRTFEMHTYGQGEDVAAIEFLSPARDKGTRMLKKDEELWMYLPAVERTQKISGHMMRQGMMGSDMSYEDMMESTKLEEQYTGVITGREEKEGRDCYRLEMTANDDSVAYPKRVSWIDVETYIAVRSELYALSGMLLKVWEMKDVKPFANGRLFPGTMVVEDQIQEGTRTIIKMKDIRFGGDIPEGVFTRRWLDRR